MTALTLDYADRDGAIARRRWALSRILIYAVLALFGLIYALPALLVLSNSFRDGEEVFRNGIIAIPESFSFDNYLRAWNDACVSGMCRGLGPNFLNSLIITVPATIATAIIGALNGYVLSKWKFPGSEFIFVMIFLGIFLPSQIALLPWAWIIGQLGLQNNVLGLLLIHTVMGISFATLFFRNFYASIPNEIVKAAQVDGAGFWRIFVRVMLPLSGPIAAVTVIWQFTQIWNEYLYGMVFTSGAQQPITVAIMGVRAGGSAATVMMAIVPPLLVYLIGGKYFVRGLTQGALK
ncbi:sugar ABC transporter permease [Devosia sp. Root413D1]|uniref:carbohydrate ABC transporter permease n=1 Tax=Devosia sp. Root413D1 TaxID=1736531 RepID=UPI0006F40735|nr:carbohydrate ABC transporter permease [Devosia sp. Root413D1]KQW81250.1 sugar ABC transporter permease [Devosia sp. Root413D1]